MSIEKHAARVITKAEKRLDTDGWLQGGLWSDDGRHCMRGAMDRALVSGLMMFRPRLRREANKVATEAVRMRVREVTEGRIFQMESYNDTEGRKADECLGVFHDAAAALVDGRFTWDAATQSIARKRRVIKAPVSLPPSAKKPVSAKKAKKEKVHG